MGCGGWGSPHEHDICPECRFCRNSAACTCPPPPTKREIPGFGEIETTPLQPIPEDT